MKNSQYCALTGAEATHNAANTLGTNEGYMTNQRVLGQCLRIFGITAHELYKSKQCDCDAVRNSNLPEQAPRRGRKP